MAKDIKRILDSVHGYVNIPTMYVDKIIDTPQFQRLRRIEQTSCRALFPSARHDRFIHSIGVFHLGSLIVEHLWDDILSDNEKHDEHLIAVIITYRLACLLHDVGHTPFSHTFEDYFDNEENDLIRTLAALIPEDVEFENEFTSQFTNDEEHLFAPHEVLSAIVALKFFKDIIIHPENEWQGNQASGIPALLARMIVGCRYLSENKSLENSFIELIHSEIIDADGLDYVCRDVWASGYSTSKVDVTRLIDSIILHKNENDQYLICYSDKALNEIKSVLQVKNFQNDFVFNHHTVKLEQKILQQAMKSAAIYHFNIAVNGEHEDIETIRENALKKLCNINMYYTRGFRVSEHEIIKYPMDDDFIHLMKMVGEEDDYIKQWFDRQYNWIPLWKRQEAFLADLTKELREDLDEHSWIFSDNCKSFLAEKCHTTKQNILFFHIKPKDRLQKLEKAYIFTNNKPCVYTKIFPIVDRESKFPTKMHSTDKLHPFVCYILIPKIMESQRARLQNQLINEWKKNLRQKPSMMDLIRKYFLHRIKTHIRSDIFKTK